jgi:serine protease Do
LNSRFGAYSLLVIAALGAVLLVGCSKEQSGPGERRVAQVPVQASTQIPADEPVARVASQVEPSVVQVNIEAIQTTPLGVERGEGVGSGVIYREDGYIITNDHVVEGANEVNIAFVDGTTARAEVVGRDPRTEIAVVRVNRDNLPAAAFNEEEPIIGQLAVAVGSPSGFESTVTSGVISGLNRELSPRLTGGSEQDPALVDLIQTDAAISPGSSGGALANRDGQIIGINVAYLPMTQTGDPTQGLGFAIPSDTAISVADQLIETGEVSSPYLGVSLADLTPSIAEQYGLNVDSGAAVLEVGPGTPADEAGLRAEDIIVGLNDTPIESSGDLLGALRDYQPGDTVQLTVVRDDNEQTFEVTLAERPG